MSRKDLAQPQPLGYWLPEDAHLLLHEVREQLALMSQLIEPRRDDDEGAAMALPLGALSRCFSHAADQLDTVLASAEWPGVPAEPA